MDLTIKTKQVLALCATKDIEERIRVFDDLETYGGILCKTDHTLLSHQQVRDAIANKVGNQQENIILITALSPTIIINQCDTTVVLAITPIRTMENENKWILFPDLIRRLPADKSRVPYIKALQILAGGLDSDATAIQLNRSLVDKIKEWENE